MPKIKIETILGTSPARPLPYLEEYLTKTAHKPKSAGESAAIGCLATVVGAVLIQVVLQQFLFWAWALLINVLVGFPILVGLVVWAVSVYRQPKRPKDKRQAEIRQVAETMRRLAAKKKLSKALGPAMAPLLEEAAKNWSRAMASLNGPFWTSDTLAGHWREVRENSIVAANEAMGDLTRIAAAELKPVSGKTDWQELIGGLVSIAVGGAQDVASREPLPAGFEPARAIAEKLSLLANEIENATTRVFREQTGEMPFSSASALDKTLSELLSIHEAEQELRQNVGDSGS